MSKPNNSIWFWQQMVTPHMATLAAALAERGFKVNYVLMKFYQKSAFNKDGKCQNLVM